MKFVLLLSLCLVQGCAVNLTVQTAKMGDGFRRRTATMTATLFDANSNVSRQRTTNTDKTQSTSVGSISDSSTSEVVAKVTEGLSKGAVKGLLPVP